VGVPLGILAVAMLGIGFRWGARSARGPRGPGTRIERNTEALTGSLGSGINTVHEVADSAVAHIELPGRGEY